MKKETISLIYFEYSNESSHIKYRRFNYNCWYTYDEIIPTKYRNWNMYKSSPFVAYLLMAYKDYEYSLDNDYSFIDILDECYNMSEISYNFCGKIGNIRPT